MADVIIEGGLFRHSYLKPEQKLADSERARFRLYKAFRRIVLRGVGDQNKDALAWRVEEKLGIRYPRSPAGYSHETFWMEADIGDLLSAITLWFQEAKVPALVRDTVSEVFRDECLHYRIDSAGGVHYLVDEEFHRVSEETITGLHDPKFMAARAALHDGLKAMSPINQSGKGLIRGVFEALESVFLVVIGPGTANRLNSQAVEKYLKPMLLDRYAGVPDADDKVMRALETLNAWVKEAHPYRHGAPFDQVHEAPLDLAVLSATSGMGFIRFLVGITVTNDSR